MKLPDAVLIGALAVGAWIIYRAISGISEVGQKALTSTREALASGLYRLFGPEERFGDDLFFNVGFPNGKRHAIGASLVDERGRFTYSEPGFANTRWQMLVGEDGKRYAAPV